MGGVNVLRGVADQAWLLPYPSQIVWLLDALLLMVPKGCFGYRNSSHLALQANGRETSETEEFLV